MKNYFLTIALLFALNSMILGQTFELPEEILLEKPEDYAIYNEDVQNAANYLLKKPYNDPSKMSSEAKAFLFLWITGSPDIQLAIDEDVMKLTKKNDEMLFVFLAAYVIEHFEDLTKEDDELKLKSIEKCLAFYEKNESMKKDKAILKMIKARDAGTLPEYLDNN